MKNKIIKTLGVGALCCVGALSLTGCSNVEVNQNQIDRLTEISESMNDFLQEEKAKSLLKKADANMLTNREQLMNNCKIVETNETGNSRNLLYYTTTTGVKMLVSYTDVTYKENDKIYSCSIDDNGERLVVNSKKEINNFEEEISKHGYFSKSIFEMLSFDVNDYALP